MGRGGGEEKEPDGFGEIVGVKLGGRGVVKEEFFCSNVFEFLPSRGCVRGVVGVKVKAYITL